MYTYIYISWIYIYIYHGCMYVYIHSDINNYVCVFGGMAQTCTGHIYTYVYMYTHIYIYYIYTAYIEYLFLISDLHLKQGLVDARTILPVEPFKQQVEMYWRPAHKTNSRLEPFVPFFVEPTWTRPIWDLKIIAAMMLFRQLSGTQRRVYLGSSPTCSVW